MSVRAMNVGELIRSANRLKREGKLDEAIALYHQVIEINPHFAWAYSNLGDIFVKQGNLDGAVSEYRRAVNLNPDCIWFNYRLRDLSAQEAYDAEAVFFPKETEKLGLYLRFHKRIKLTLAKEQLLHQDKQRFTNNIYNGISSYINDCEIERTEKFKNLKIPKKNIFITARYRTGSTYLYSLFSIVTKVKTFYEPLHPQIVSHFLDADHTNIEEAKAIQNHTFKSNYFYFDEYKLLNRKKLIGTYQTSFANSKMFLSSLDRFSELKTYINLLIFSQSEQEELNVLQFNRIDFRLAWFRINFPNAIIVNLRRNPRDVYASYIGVYERVSQQKYRASNTSLGEFYYLDNYINFLSEICPQQLNKVELNNYEKIYILSQLSDLWGDKFADLVIHYESLVDDPVGTLYKIVSYLPNFKLDFKEDIIQPNKDRVNVWQNYHSENWFKRCEERCKRIIEQILSFD
ncbi:MAG: tetratricopeptide repeat protein [Limnoraphis sp. WC205]|jgi:tetratricopeptide (TPR) repeat protein|nr:tetratricopeptide repeat protein [Limnoraphis sp. WC205]